MESILLIEWSSTEPKSVRPCDDATSIKHEPRRKTRLAKKRMNLANSDTNRPTDAKKDMILTQELVDILVMMLLD